MNTELPPRGRERTAMADAIAERFPRNHVEHVAQWRLVLAETAMRWSVDHAKAAAIPCTRATMRREGMEQPEAGVLQQCFTVERDHSVKVRFAGIGSFEIAEIGHGPEGEPLPAPPEWIVGSAVQVVATGVVFALPAPCRHHHCIHAMAKHGFETPIGPCGRYDQGFVTNYGRYVGRVEALEVARAAGQLIADEPIRAGELFSENLW